MYRFGHHVNKAVEIAPRSFQADCEWIGQKMGRHPSVLWARRSVWIANASVQIAGRNHTPSHFVGWSILLWGE